MTKNTFLLMLACWLALSVMATPVDVARARGEAAGFMASKSLKRFSSPATVSLELAYAQPSAIDASAVNYYVFNASDGSAFVIVSGDNRAETILAYGEGSIDMDLLPCNVRCWLDQYSQQMEQLLAMPSHQPMRASADYPVVSPLLTCRWDQISPYNRMCPEFNGSRCLTGCVATAMAQVMYYWQYPESAPALPAYTTGTKNISVPALPGELLHWENMIDAYKGSNFTDEQADAVAALMRYCGQAVEVDYMPGSSGAFIGHVMPALRAFGYNSAVTMLTRYNYSDSMWVEMIHEDLMSGRPILYFADNVSGSISHAFVIDGYDGNKYHINWGWGGIADGYFALDAFTYGMNYRHSMIFQTFPEDKDGVQQAYDFEAGGIFYKLTGTTVRVSNGPGSYCGDVIIPDVVVHDGQVYPVTAIGPAAFAGSTALTSVAIGGNVMSVGDNAFGGCAALKKVALPARPVVYHHQAFAGCTALDTVALADLDTWFNASFLDEEACPMFYAHHPLVGGKEITHVDVPEGMTSLQDYLFRNWQSLESVNIPGTVTSIGRYVFYHCTALTQVTLGDGVTSIGYCAFAGCKRLAAINLPASLRDIERYAFSECERLETLVIPDSITTIKAYSFRRCTRLRNVTLGAAMDSLGYYAFMSCTALDTIVCKASRPPRMRNKSCFSSSTYADAVLLVPRASFVSYQDDAYWGLFSQIGYVANGVGPYDMNGDGELNIADVNILINVIIAGRTGPYDANGDGEVTIADVNALIDSVLGP